MRILVIEDDKIIGDGINVGLTHFGFSVDWFCSGKTGFHALMSAPYDAVVLDLTLPEMDGIDILRHWRAKHDDTPVLILTARDSIDQRVEGLKQGADDYLCKPFALTELVARLEALIRRRTGTVHPIIEYGNIRVDRQNYRVSVNGKDIALTAMEWQVLSLFLQHKNRTLTRTFIEEKLHNWNSEVSSNAIEVHIHHLRKKLGNTLIKTVHGIGYRLGNCNEN
ncbi:response regulator [Spirabiliibacterium falconis]|uniref:response regulator n=1 Tax=Spirabiliibacterium falconis TaxID=572023 RepID=UPI001AACB3E3|nr:response regulator [Spirabiliibacterium falconis]MBE2894968.1 response regulator [Spirabiliibacterium falconis]